MHKKTPRLSHALRLKCPHCGLTPLRREDSWFQFQEGCSRCRYTFEREEGYFTGASWVITYTVGGAVGLITGAVLLWRFPETDALVTALLAAGLAGIAAFAFMPWGKALWMVLDHSLHPLDVE